MSAVGSVVSGRLPEPKGESRARGGVAPPAPATEVYRHDASTAQRVLLRNSGKPSGDAVADTAYENAQKVQAFFRTTFGRNGFDGQGSPLRMEVHASVDNAQWNPDTRDLAFSDGDGTSFAPFGNALDVVAHEYSHGVVDSEVRLGYTGQSAALHESFADVLAVLVDADDWQLGEDIYTPAVAGDALRDLSRPEFSHVSKLPPLLDEPHVLSSIPSYAAYQVAQKVGRQEMGRIWYSALVDHLTPNSGYAGAARATAKAAAQMFGIDSTQYAAVEDAWRAVGVSANWTAEHRAQLHELAGSSASDSPDSSETK